MWWVCVHLFLLVCSRRHQPYMYGDGITFYPWLQHTPVRFGSDGADLYISFTTYGYIASIWYVHVKIVRFKWSGKGQLRRSNHRLVMQVKRNEMKVERDRKRERLQRKQVVNDCFDELNFTWLRRIYASMSFRSISFGAASNLEWVFHGKKRRNVRRRKLPYTITNLKSKWKSLAGFIESNDRISIRFEW